MKKRYDEKLEAYLEVLDRVNMLGDTSFYDEEMKKDVVESFIRKGYLKEVALENDTILIYKDEKRAYYMHMRFFKECTKEEIESLNI